MALINCPECGKAISDQSEVCIHCGFPINKKRYIVINGVKCDAEPIYEALEKFKAGEMSDLEKNYRILNHFTNHSNLGHDAKAELTKIIIETFSVPESFNGQTMEQWKAEQNKPHCPKCKSTSIATEKRGYSLLTGLLGSNKTINRCANCGYSWTPKR